MNRTLVIVLFIICTCSSTDAQVVQRLWAKGGMRGGLKQFRFSPSGDQIAAIGTIGTEAIKVWDVSSLTLRDVYHNTGGLTLDYSPDGLSIAYGWTSACRMDLHTRNVDSLIISSPNVRGISYSASGNVIAVNEGKQITLVDVMSKSVIREFRGEKDYVSSPVFYEDSLLFAANKSGDVFACDVETGGISLIYQSNGISTGLDLHGEYLAIHAGIFGVTVVNWRTTEEAFPPLEIDASVTSIAWNSLGNRFVVTTKDGASCYDTEGTLKWAYDKTIQGVWTDWSPTGDVIALSDFRENLWLLDAETGKAIGNLNEFRGTVELLQIGNDSLSIVHAGQWLQERTLSDGALNHETYQDKTPIQQAINTLNGLAFTTVNGAVGILSKDLQSVEYYYQGGAELTDLSYVKESNRLYVLKSKDVLIRVDLSNKALDSIALPSALTFCSIMPTTGFVAGTSGYCALVDLTSMALLKESSVTKSDILTSGILKQEVAVVGLRNGTIMSILLPDLTLEKIVQLGDTSDISDLHSISGRVVVVGKLSGRRQVIDFDRSLILDDQHDAQDAIRSILSSNDTVAISAVDGTLEALFIDFTKLSVGTREVRLPSIRIQDRQVTFYVDGKPSTTFEIYDVLGRLLIRHNASSLPLTVLYSIADAEPIILKLMVANRWYSLKFVVGDLVH